MKFKKMIFVLILWPLVIFMITSLVSCRFISFGYKGLTVPEKNHILLKNEGTHEGNFQTEDIAVNYTYSKNGDRLEISGLIDFDDSLKYNFTSLDEFDLWIYFVNSQNKITENIRISPFTAFNQIEAAPFEKNVVLPADTIGMVFSYSGEASEGGGQTFWIFWKTPHG